eukprot:TRINITY_DN1408_c0_g1_i1.p1 TRINITY_DN1408_c0_g1~~TRINITY_DN1408_c0_g1_i1.p1  ORF type:complete len:153 (+),score=37.29 TRINITY_DN1408_c0_g1_i1:28-486(+)
MSITKLFSEQNKLTLIFVGCGFLFMIFGVLNFLDRSLILLGNLLFMVGVCFHFGFDGAIKYFKHPRHIKGTIIFFVGFSIIVSNILYKLTTLIGIIIEIYGILTLFSNFVPGILTVLRHTPYVGKLFKIPAVHKFLTLFIDKGSISPFSSSV